MRARARADASLASAAARQHAPQHIVSAMLAHPLHGGVQLAALGALLALAHNPAASDELKASDMMIEHAVLLAEEKHAHSSEVLQAVAAVFARLPKRMPLAVSG